MMRSCRTSAFFVLLLSATALLAQDHAVSSTPASPEANMRRFEIGGQAADLRLGGCFGLPHCTTPQFGLGAGSALNLNPHFAISSSVNLLPRNDIYHGSFVNGAAEGGHLLEFVTGIRAEVRARRYGFFADAKPGLVSWSEVLTSEIFTPTGPNTYDVTNYNSRRTFFAMKFGGGVEYSPSARVHFRIDMGDLLVRYNDTVYIHLPSQTSSYCDSPCKPWLNNLQTTAGVYFGLGRPIIWTPPDMRARPQHRFLNDTNVALMGASLLGQAADAITTQRFIHDGLKEGNPLAAPLVKYGWSGQIGLAVLTNGAEISGMYGLHRMHQHWIERMVPIAIATASGIVAYRNTQASNGTNQ
jgi:hypothetical protein